MSIKLRFIKVLEKVLFLRLMLFVILLLKRDIRKRDTKKTTIIISVFFYFIKALNNHVLFFVIGIINRIRESRTGLRIRKYFVSKLPYYKSYYHQINLPVNLVKEDEKHYSYRDYFITKPLKLKSIKKCHVYLATEFGIVFRKFHILRDSIHGKLDKRNIKILKSYHEMVFENYINNKFRIDGNIIKADNSQNYLLIHNWFNYYHWITETLYRYFSLPEKDYKKYTLVLPETLKEISYVKETVEHLNKINIVFFPNNSYHFYQKIDIVTQKKYCDHYDRNILLKIKEYFYTIVKNNKIEAPVKEKRIFISRRGNRREIINNDNLLVLLEKYNFAVVDFESYSFLEQVAIMQHSKFMAGVYGAGLTNMLFMPEESRVMGIQRKVQTQKDHHCLVYWRMAGELKHQYYYHYFTPVLCDPGKSAQERKYYFNTEFHAFKFSIDLIKFEKDLKLFLS